MYSVHMWFMKENSEADTTDIPGAAKDMQPEVFENNIEKEKRNVKPKVIPLFLKDGCTVLQIFTEKPPVAKYKAKKVEDMDANNNALTMFGIAVFLVILTVNAVLDAIKVKEEERVKRQLNPSGERRQSLAEFANKKTLRRGSSKIGQQLFQIAESFVNNDEEKKPRRPNKPYTRGDSTNSYLSECTRKTQGEGSAPASISEVASAEPRLVKRQSVAKLIGMFLFTVVFESRLWGWKEVV